MPKQRCFTCNKKLRFGASYKCKYCEKQFCGEHRYESVHGCGDVAAAEKRAELEAKLIDTKVVSDKIGLA